MSSSTGQTEFRIATCKGCNSEIRLPMAIKATAKIQCPICQATFTVGDLIGPPVAIIIDEEPANPTPADAVVVDSNIPHVDRVVGSKGKEDVWNSISVPSYERTTARGRSKLANPELDSPPEFTRPRTKNYLKSEKRRKEKFKPNSRKDLLKIIVGGLLALPVAQLILWWMFTQDPLALAPTVHKYAPVLVPAKLSPPAAAKPEPELKSLWSPDAPANMRVIKREE